ncbi:MAG: sensor histidine kinase, partial [Pseudomonadales bacterium]|nr:sensor histidine kinase [Pseudomonadales bacterium]
MRQNYFRPLLFFLLLLVTDLAIGSVPLSAATPKLSLDGHFKHFVDVGGAKPFEVVAQPAFVEAHFALLPSSRSLGYNTDAHWFRVILNPATDAPRRWVLAIGSAELENVDVWIGDQTQGFQHYALGYHQPYKNRPLQTRLFAMPVDVFSGMQVFLRVRTTNALNIHATLWQINAFTAHETRDNFYRGSYFGILLIVVVFYFIFGLRSMDVVLLAYAGYIASQLLFHLGTNGYLPVLAGTDGTWATDALPRIGWLGGAACIALMWDRLLALKQSYLWWHRFYLFGIVFSLMFLPFALIPFLVGEWLLYFVKLANVLNIFIFLVSVTLLLVYWRRDRRVEWIVYFVAFVIPALATAVNTGLNQGWLPWNTVITEFYQAATLVHVVVMSYGLALRLRQMQMDKQTAEREAVLATQRTEEQRRFVAMLSHEFGNPLAAIDRAAQMIQIKMHDLPLLEQQRLHQIRNNASTLAGFVSNFLVTEALDHDAVELVCKPWAIDALLEQSLQQLDDDARARLHVTITPQDASFVLDATLIQAALGNLVINALRYSSSVSEVDITVVQSAAGLRITVIDRGPGLSQAELETLGKPYFRATSSQGKVGSGLGYYFSRRIVEAHGGKLTARSPARGGLE